MSRHVHFADMTWPRADTDLGWKLRYAEDSLTREDRLVLASIVDAYNALVMEKTCAQRNRVVSGLRKAMSAALDSRGETR